MNGINATSIGCEAARLLRKGGDPRIIGSTSKGLFIRVGEAEVLFISYEPYRSPVTINLGRPYDGLLALEIGEEVAFFPHGITLGRDGTRIDCAQLVPWVPPPPSGEVSEGSARTQRLSAIAKRVVSAKPDSGFCPLVSVLLLDETTVVRQEDQAVLASIRSILRHKTGPDLEQVLAELPALIGFGRGLTPSGDDFALGFLLAINRWRDTLGYERSAVDAFNQGVVGLADRKTTSLSRAFLRQAASGRGDERLLAVIDGIMTGEPGEDLCLKYVLETGNSSGIDSFLGMAAGVL